MVGALGLYAQRTCCPPESHTSWKTQKFDSAVWVCCFLPSRCKAGVPVHLFVDCADAELPRDHLPFLGRARRSRDGLLGVTSVSWLLWCRTPLAGPPPPLQADPPLGYPPHRAYPPLCRSSAPGLSPPSPALRCHVKDGRGRSAFTLT